MLRSIWKTALLVTALLGCGGSSTSPRRDAGRPGNDGGIATGGTGGSGGSNATDAASSLEDAGGLGGTGGVFGESDAGSSSSPDAGQAAADASSDGSVGFPGDAGVSGDGFAGPPPPPPPPPAPCTITIDHVSPQRFDNLPAGNTSKLRVRGLLGGTQPPAVPRWIWTVSYEGGAPFTPSIADMDPSMVEFPLLKAGHYAINASVTADCVATQVVATAVDRPTAQFWVRVTPPPKGVMAGNGQVVDVMPLESVFVDVPAGQSVVGDLALRSGVDVSIDPQTSNGQQAIFSYVRITSTQSTVRFEGHTQQGPYDVHLDPSLSYDVLVIPDGAVAPQVFPGTPAELNQTSFQMDSGVPVTGRVTDSGGRPVQNTRILLRSTTAVPSTTGIADATGAFSLRARAGDFEAVIIPPPESGLPEARVATNSGVVIYEPDATVALDFSWLPLVTSALDLTVHKSDGSLAAGVHVRLASVPGSLDPVGTLTIAQQFPLQAQGVVQSDATTDGRGLASFANLPHGMYNATLTPLDGSAAITVVSITLTGSARVAQTAQLASKILLTGKLLPPSLTMGANLLALDPQADPSAPTPVAVIGSDGGYALAVAPGRSYDLVLEAVPAQRLPRTLLRSIVAPMKDTVRDNLIVPPGLTISGRVTAPLRTGAAMSLAGASVEAYCVGAPPSCIDPNNRDTTNVRPTAQAVSDGSGHYELLVPDPAIAY